MTTNNDPIVAQPGQGLAIAALVCGFLGFLTFGLASVGAIVCGILALQKGQSKGMAITGLIAGGFSMLILPIAIIAAIAIPSMLSSRVTANEAAAAATLKSGFFPAQVMVQSGAYIDQDGDGIGEYATLAEMIGTQKAGTKKLSMMGPQLGNLPNNGYNFRVYLPDGKGGAMSSDQQARVENPEAANAQERAFVVYAWPASNDTGRRVYALCQDGTLRSPVTQSVTEPKWNDVFGGGDFSTEPVWPVYRR